MKKAILIGEKPLAAHELERSYDKYKDRLNYKITNILPFCYNSSIIWQLPSYNFTKFNLKNKKFCDKYYYDADFCQNTIDTLKVAKPDFIIIGNSLSAIGTFEGLSLLNSFNWPLKKTVRMVSEDENHPVFEEFLNLEPIDKFIHGHHVKMNEYDKEYKIDNPFIQMQSMTDSMFTI